MTVGNRNLKIVNAPDSASSNEASKKRRILKRLRNLEKTYLDTVFSVELPEGTFELRVQASPRGFEQWLREHHQERWTLLSPCNPASRKFIQKKNSERLRKAEKELQELGLSYFPALGLEPGFIVFGLSVTESQNLGRSWGQNLVVCGGRNAPTELVWCLSESEMPLLQEDTSVAFGEIFHSCFDSEISGNSLRPTALDWRQFWEDMKKVFLKDHQTQSSFGFEGDSLQARIQTFISERGESKAGHLAVSLKAGTFNFLSENEELLQPSKFSQFIEKCDEAELPSELVRKALIAAVQALGKDSLVSLAESREVSYRRAA